MDEHRAAVRRAYELSRARMAIGKSTVGLPAGLAAYAAGTGIELAALFAVGLAVVTAVAGWWRNDAGEGASAGTAVIAIPVVLGMYMRTLGRSMSPEECAVFCLYGAALMGGIAGYLLGRAAGTRPVARAIRFGFAATTTSVFSMTVGCSAVGFGSLFGLAVGLLLVGVPSFAWARAHATSTAT